MRIVGISLTLTACLLLAKPVVASEGCGAPDCCAHCGCTAACQPVTCQVVAGVTKVKKHCWCVECVPFAPSMPGGIPNLYSTLGGLLDGLHGKTGCGECGGCELGCEATCGKETCVVPPECGKVRTKKILVKKEYEVEVPVYKTVVKNLCGECGCNPDVIGPQPAPGPTTAPAPAPLPPGPMQGTPVAPPPAPMPGQQAYDFSHVPPAF